MAFEVQNPFQNFIAQPWDELTMEEDGGLFVESIVTTNTQSKDGKNKDKTVKTFGNGDKEIVEYQHTKAADETISLLDDNKIPGFTAQGFPTTYSGGIETENVFIPAAFDGTEKSAMEAYLGNKKYEAGRNFFQQALLSSIEKQNNSMQNNISSRHPDEVKKGYFESLFDLDTSRLDRTNAEIEADNKIQAIRDGKGYPYRAGPTKSIDKYTTDSVKGSGVSALREEELAENIFERDSIASQYAQFGTPVKGSGKPALRGEELAESFEATPPPLTEEDKNLLTSSKAAQESLDLLRKELKVLEDKGDRLGSREVYLDFLKENGVLKDFRPDLYKALAGAAFGMLMGQDIDDAFFNSFGGIQAEKDAAAEAALKFEQEKEIEMLKSGNKGGTKFGKDSKWVNLGTTKAPIKVKMTTREDGVPVVSYKGTILTFDDLAKMNLYPKEYYAPDVVEKHRNDLVTNLQSDIASLMTNSKFKDKEDIDKYVNILKAKSQIRGGVRELERDGVDVGPGMGDQWYQVLTNAADDFITNKTNDNSKFKDKSYINFVKDRITKARIQEAGISDFTEFEPPEYQLEYIGGKLVPNKDKPFELNPKGWALMRKDAEEWFNAFAKNNEGLEGITEAQINRDQLRVAYIAYQAEKEKIGDTWMLNAAAGYKAGYLPFMYWLRENT